MPEKREISYPTPEAIAYPNSDDRHRWGKLLISKSNFEVAIARTLRLRGRDLELANKINAFRSDDINNYNLVTEIGRSIIATWRTDLGLHMQEAANIRLTWELSGSGLPRRIREALQGIQLMTSTLDWGELDDAKRAHGIFVAALAVTKPFIDTNPAVQKVLAYSREHKPVLDEHWSKFLTQNGFER